jgi:hypothetical protein
MKIKPGNVVGIALSVLCAFGMLCLIAYALLPWHTEFRDYHGMLTQVSILDRDSLFLVGVFILVASIVVLFVRQPLVGTCLLVVTLLASAFSFMTGSVKNLAPWTIYDHVIASDGNEYCFIDSSFLQGQEMAIGRVQSSGPLYHTLDVLGTTSGDAPRSFLRVTLPTPSKPVPYGALYATPTGLLVGIRCGRDCYMVYDIPNNRFYGHGDVEELSTNLLVDGRLY